MKIAFFDAKEYDIDKFNDVNRGYSHELRYFYDRLNAGNADLARDTRACAYLSTTGSLRIRSGYSTGRACAACCCGAPGITM